MSYLNALFHLALGSSVLLCALLSLLLWRKAGAVSGATHLVRFLLGTLVGISGFWLLSIPGAWSWRWGEMLVATSPLVAGLFTHFAYRFTMAGTTFSTGKRVVGIGYLLGGVGTLLVWSQGLGTPVHGETPPVLVTLSHAGWWMVLLTVGGTLPGHLRLIIALGDAEPLQRRQIWAVIGASLWGVLAMAGFFLPAWGVGSFPYLVLLLPGYPILLVYGLLRYRLMNVNIWARRLVAWLLLTIPITALGVGALAWLASPGEGSFSPRVWVMQFVSLTIALLLVDVVRRWAERLVFPGSRLNRWAPERWSEALSATDDPHELEEMARTLISAHLKMAVEVTIMPPPAREIPDTTVPAIICHQRDERWTHTLKGWEQAPPGPRLAADLFGRLIETSVGRLERTRQVAELARQREKEAHLAELGLLAATVAHELRNPLNIVAMATTGMPDEVQKEIRRQLERMNALIGDLLDYSKAWRIAPRSMRLSAAVENALSAFPGLAVERSVPPDLRILADPQRLQQVLGNLLANAQAALGADGAVSSGRGVGIFSVEDATGVRLLVCNQGAEIPDHLRERIFAPFVSRTEGGTGLGLAIVARIMEAHGGSIKLGAWEGWKTCFELSFQKAESLESMP